MESETEKDVATKTTETEVKLTAAPTETEVKPTLALTKAQLKTLKPNQTGRKKVRRSPV